MISSDKFTVLCFPCNQFGAQEPGSNAEVKDFAIKKGLSKVLFAKIDVNGPAAHPLYVKLKKDASNKTFMSSMLGNNVRWNFGKFLISNGKSIKR
jgi:glutathione peroxidase